MEHTLAAGSIFGVTLVLFCFLTNIKCNQKGKKRKKIIVADKQTPSKQLREISTDVLEKLAFVQGEHVCLRSSDDFVKKQKRAFSMLDFHVGRN